MQKKGFPGFTFCEFHSLPVSFRFSAFRELTPLDASNIWDFKWRARIDAYLPERNRLLAGTLPETEEKLAHQEK